MRSFPPLFFWCACITVERMSKSSGLGKALMVRMPDLPVVHVGSVRIVRNFLEVGAGRTGPVRHRVGILTDCALENIGEKNYVILPNAIARTHRNQFFEFLTVPPVIPSSFNFIISTPDHDAGMIAQALDLADPLLPDVFLEA